MCLWMHLVNGTGNSLSPGRPTPGVVKQENSSGGSVDTTKTRLGPQRVRMCSGQRPIGAAKGKQTIITASCQPPPPHPQSNAQVAPGGGGGGGPDLRQHLQVLRRLQRAAVDANVQIQRQQFTQLLRVTREGVGDAAGESVPVLQRQQKGRRVGATMGQVCFTAISSNRACPTVIIALSSV